MAIATEKWSDNNRFNQTGYSARTLFPLKENYVNMEFYEADLKAAQRREESHQEFLEELRMEAAEEQWCIDNECECDCEKDPECCEEDE
jgi:hypothetical protein